MCLSASCYQEDYLCALHASLLLLAAVLLGSTLEGLNHSGRNNELSDKLSWVIHIQNSVVQGYGLGWSPSCQSRMQRHLSGTAVGLILTAPEHGHFGQMLSSASVQLSHRGADRGGFYCS